MIEKPKLELVDTPTDSVFDDIEALRKTATIKVSRRVVAVNVAVGKPKNNIYFRCHPDPAMSLDASVLVGPEGSEISISWRRHVEAPRCSASVAQGTIAIVYSWPGGAISLWPVPSDEEHRIACWKSARAAFEMSKTEWVQMIWNAEKRDYDVARPRVSIPSRCGRTISTSGTS